MNLEQTRDAILRAPLWVKIILGLVWLLVFLITLPITFFLMIGYTLYLHAFGECPPEPNPESEDDEP